MAEFFNVEYYHMPPQELRQAVQWLRGMADDANNKADRIESLISQKERQSKYRMNLNDLADMFDRPDFAKHPKSLKIDIIAQRLGCDHIRADNILKMLEKRKKARESTQRNKAIIQNYIDGMNHTKNARQNGVTRQTVHNIINAEKKRRLL